MSESLGKYLKRLRDARKRTLRQVEADIGVNNSHLSQLENDSIKKPSSELLLKLATYYGVEFESLKSLAGLEESNSISVTKSSPGIFRILSASELVTFSSQKEAEGLLPQLIRELIFASGILEPVTMPVASSNYLHGWDGVVHCKNNLGSEYLPIGFSCWEMGKGKDPKSKAEDDYKKRTKNPLGVDSAKAVFVFVSMQRWERESKEKWIEEKLADKKWKDVRVIDVEDIEIWLERNPVIALTYARKMRIFPAISAEPIKEFWDRWWLSTTPSIDEELLLEAGKRVAGVEDFLKSENQDQIKIKSKDQEVGIALFYAKVSKLDDEQLRESILSRTILVSDPAAFNELIAKSSRLILIPRCAGCALGAAKAKGHRVVIVSSDYEIGDMATVGRASTSKISKHLAIESGMKGDQAERIAKNSHGNLSVLRMMLGDKSEISVPAWCNAEIGIDMAPLALLGGWNSSNSNDKALIEIICGKPYAEIERLLTSILTGERPPFEKHGSTYLFFHEYAVTMLLPYISIERILVCLNAFRDVLSEVNTKYELAPEDRFAASIYKKGVSYSETARKCSATSLALLASLETVNSHDIKAIVRNKVREIFEGKKDWRFWASLDQSVMLLAEASPDAFLTNLKIAIESGESDFSDYLRPNSMMGGTEYAELLWALELCAWSPEYLFPVTRILMLLSAFEDTTSNVVNQPSNSLWEIFKIWGPQTNATLNERMKILQKLEPEFPQPVWKLLIRMIPGRHEFGHSTYRPRFTDIEQQRSNRNIHKEADIVLDEILKRVNKAAYLWVDLFDEIFDLPVPALQIKLLEKLVELPKELLDQKTSSELWDKIEKKYANHLEFAGTGWSFKGRRLELLKNAYERFSPDDLVVRWSRFFDYWVRHPLFAKEGKDYKKHADRVREHQRKVFKEILEKCGIEGIVQLIKSAPNVFLLGELASEIGITHEILEKWLEKFDLQNITEREVKFLQGYAFRYQIVGGIENTRRLYGLLTKILNHKMVLILTNIPFEKKSWDLIESFGAKISEEYWKNVSGGNYVEVIEEAVFVSEKFIRAGRAMPAFHVLASMVSFAKNENKDFPADWAMKILDYLLEKGFDESDYPMGISMFQHHLEQILKNLAARENVDRKRLAILEWNFLPLFKYHSAPKNLINAVNEDPDLFSDMIRMAYKGDSSVEETETEINEAAASRAHDFLGEHKTLPGVRDDGTFDGSYFQTWANKVRQKCAGIDRKDIADYVLGKLIAYAPYDDLDGAWPHRAVRDLIEEFNSDHLDDGVSIELFNKRGGYTKSLYEGGVQERQIAQRYEDWEKASSLLWSRTSAILREMKRRYLSDAEREDQRAVYEEHKFNS